ncbi:tetratricopeptide repeat protein, partial [Albimonas pacifica]
AMVYLGNNLEEGVGAEADPVAANGWYRRAAELEDAEAMVYLGNNLEEGVGAEADPVAANGWYRRAAELGDARAMGNLGNKLARGVGAEADPAAALQWSRRAVEAGGVEFRGGYAVLSALLGEDGPSLLDESAIVVPSATLRGDWIDLPPVPALWRDMGEPDAEDCLTKLAQAAGLEGTPGLFAGLCATALRTAEPPCYPDLALVDVQFASDADNDVRLVSALVGPKGATLLDGTSSRLSMVNKLHLRLDEPVEREAYLRIFCGFARGAEDPFIILDCLEDIPFASAPLSMALPEASITPPKELRATENGTLLSAVVLGGNVLFRAEFNVLPDGMVHILMHEQISGDLPLRRRKYDGVFRSCPR